MSYFSPISCVLFLIHGEARSISRYSMTLSSILSAAHVSTWLNTQRRSTVCASGRHSRAFDLAKVGRFDSGLVCRGQFGQRSSDFGVVEVGNAAVLRIKVSHGSRIDSLSIANANVPVWCMTTIVPGEPIVCSTASVRRASNTRPPALRTIVASMTDGASARLTLVISERRSGGRTQGLIDAQDLVRIESRVGARHDHDACPGSLHGGGHLHQARWCLVRLREFAMTCQSPWGREIGVTSEGARTHCGPASQQLSR